MCVTLEYGQPTLREPHSGLIAMDLMYVTLLLLAALTGLSVGSFLNVVSDRIPAGQSLMSPPSSCPACGTRIRSIDLIPLVSYLVLRGKCRSCASGIPIRTLWVEIATGLIFALLWIKFGWTYEGAAMMAYASLFLAIFIIDIEHHIIPNKIVLVGLVAAIAIASFWPGVGPVKALIGAGAGFGILLALYLIPGFVIGEGDVKLAAVVGAATGFPIVAVGLGLSFVMGGVVAMLLIITRRSRRKAEIPFGPFIAASAMITLVWGDAILAWYLAQFAVLR